MVRVYGWVRGVVALASMPAPWELEWVAGEFDAVVSLATPSEHAWGGYDPRSAGGLAGFHWLPTPPYNAPGLGRLARAVLVVEDWVREGRRVLVHAGQGGCGRQLLLAASWLAVREGLSPWAALAEAGRDVPACRLESRAQLGALRAASLLSPTRELVEAAARLGGDDVAEAAVEYGLVAGQELSPYTGSSPCATASRALEALGRRGTLPCRREDEGGPGVFAAELVREADYAVAWLTAARRGRDVGVRVEVWVSRGAHPAAARPPRPRAERLAEALQEALAPAGLRGLVEVRVYPPDRPPEP